MLDCVSLWNVLKELERPNSFQLNSNKPNTVVNAVNYVFTAFMANWYITSSQIKGGGRIVSILIVHPGTHPLSESE